MGKVFAEDASLGFFGTLIERICYAKRGFERILIASLWRDFYGFDCAVILILNVFFLNAKVAKEVAEGTETLRFF